MKNRIRTTAAAAAVFTGIAGAAIVGGFSAVAADPGDGSGTATEWCDEYGNHQGWDGEEHAQFHDQMESHMGDFMGMGMGMSDGFDVDGMDPGSGMGSGSTARGSSMGR